MPYITKKRAKELTLADIDGNKGSSLIEELSFRTQRPGELNYVISSLLAQYAKGYHGDLSYAQLNETYGAGMLACAEFKRMMIDPYEQSKQSDSENANPFKE